MSGLGQLNSGFQQGAQQPSDTLIIGGTPFLDEEHPNDLALAFKRAWAITVNVGGSRVAQDLGPNPGDITWQGELFDANVQQRIAALTAMYAAGQQVLLTWLIYAFNVVIKDFTPTYNHRYRAGYKITIAIISDQSGQYTSSPPPSTDEQVDNLLSQAADLESQVQQQDPINTAALIAAFNALAAALELAGILSSLTGAELSNLIGLAQTAAGAAASYANSIGGTNGNSAQYLATMQLEAIGNLIAQNLQYGQSTRSVVVHGAASPDLFTIASQVYGDPSYAFPLAAANGLSSPLLSASKVYTIVLPASLTLPSAA